ncbi:Two component system response regulator/histidine kinase [Desulfonema limicola]|uniref:histidine kinase n=1 Tax=Desulfonema limicola TaxID=45656 RepID=A0A975B5S4_9BACT|nr:hybrid sensor histidine kinase/response regulator [Desulfonema limicola]QTA79307.1 Two component system response regulator/histidine kinase [Desulfonema limicola]
MTDRRWRVLIVDDEPYNLQLMRQVLEDRYQLSFAPNGIKALEIAKKIIPDLILLDIMMPEMDGYEVCRRLKADKTTRLMPVIFVTAKMEIEDEAKGLELGAIDYIAKPISPSIVRARIKNHLELKLAREKIERQKKILEEQNKAIIEASCLREDVEHIMRHDLKSPLNSIIVLPEIMMEHKNLPEEIIENLKQIEEAGLKMLDMINLSLDIIKMERGVYEFEAVDVNILNLIRKVINENHYIMKQKGLSFNIDMSKNPEKNEDIFLVRGENLLCYTMLSNLIKNAVEASPEDEKIIINMNHEKNQGIINIQNKGEVPEKIRTRFFDKYVTLSKTKGTGLGTYSARLIAEIQGGSIHLDTSTPGFTTITIKLPAQIIEEDKDKEILPLTSLNTLPLELISRMIPPLQEGDVTEMENLITEIYSYDVQTGKTIKALTDNFQFEKILKIIQEEYRNAV